MIAALLAAFALQSSADDCAVLEAAVRNPVLPLSQPFADEHIITPWNGRNFIGFRPARIGMDLYCFWERGIEPAQLSLLEQCEREAIDLFESLSPEERRTIFPDAGDYFAAWIDSDAPRAWESGDGRFPLPEGLAASFADAVYAHDNWGCRSAEWEYLEGDYYRGVAETRLTAANEQFEPGYYLSMSHPGYSADGRWAVVFYQDTMILTDPVSIERVEHFARLRDRGPITAFASSGFRIFERRNGRWVHARHLGQTATLQFSLHDTAAPD